MASSDSFKTPINMQLRVPSVPRSRAAWKAAISTGDGETKSSQWINQDLAPTPRDKRTWSWISLTSYWWGNAFNASQWSNGSSLISVGLTWWQALISCILSNLLSSSVALALGRPGARYHIGFPVLARSVFGMYGHFFFVWVRAVVAIIWFGVQSYFGSQLFSVMLRCIFGSSWWDMANHLPASAGITSRDLLAFFLFWMVEMPFLAVHPSKIKFLFAAESIVCPLACVGVFAWCIHYGGGLQIDTISDTVTATATASLPLRGSSLGWAMLNGINSCLGVTSALLVNQPDLTRYVRRTKDAGWRQAFSIFVSKTLIFFSASARRRPSKASLGRPTGTSGTCSMLSWTASGARGRVPAAFLPLLGSRSASSASTLAAMPFPLAPTSPVSCHASSKLARPAVLRHHLTGHCAVEAAEYVVDPIQWAHANVPADGSGFITFLGSYNIFIAPICGIVIVDYYFIKRGNIHVPSLFNPQAGSLYYYTKGWNLKALASWACAATFGIPGLIGSYHPKAVNIAATHIYQMGWIITLASAVVFYSCANILLPAKVNPAGYSPEDIPNGFEGFAATDGYLGDDALVEFPPGAPVRVTESESTDSKEVAVSAEKV